MEMRIPSRAGMTPQVSHYPLVMFKLKRFSLIDLGQVYPKTHKKHDYGAVLFYFFKCFLKSSVTLDQGFSFFTYMQFRMQHSCHTTCKKRQGQNTVTLQQNNRCKMHSRLGVPNKVPSFFHLSQFYTATTSCYLRSHIF